jgi:hypothetical protein
MQCGHFKVINVEGQEGVGFQHVFGFDFPLLDQCEEFLAVVVVERLFN